MGTFTILFQNCECPLLSLSRLWFVSDHYLFLLYDD